MEKAYQSRVLLGLGLHSTEPPKKLRDPTRGFPEMGHPNKDPTMLSKPCYGACQIGILILEHIHINATP